MCRARTDTFGSMGLDFVRTDRCRSRFDVRWMADEIKREKERREGERGRRGRYLGHLGRSFPLILLREA